MFILFFFISKLFGRESTGPEAMAKRKSNSKVEASKKTKVQDVDENASDEEEYEVEKIIHHRKFSNGNVEYLVRWKGYGPDDDTWEKEKNLTSSALIIAEYKDNLPDSSADEDEENTNGNEHDDEEDKGDSVDDDDDADTPKKKGSAKKGKKSGSAKKETPKKAAKGRGRPKGKAGKKPKHDSDEEDGEETTEEYEVEKIIDVHSGKQGKKEYLVRWKGFTSKDDTWEPEEHLTCPDLIQAFNNKLEKIKGASEKALRVAPQKTNRLIVQNSKPSGRHSKRNVGKRKSYAEDE